MNWFFKVVAFLMSVRRGIRIFFVFAYVGWVVALSLLPPQDFPQIPLFEGADKVVHFILYFIFSMLGCWALKAERKFSMAYYIVPLTIGWGILMEVFQLSMHLGRSFSWYDILANSFGTFTGTLIYLSIVLKINVKS